MYECYIILFLMIDIIIRIIGYGSCLYIMVNRAMALIKSHIKTNDKIQYQWYKDMGIVWSGHGSNPKNLPTSWHK